MVTLYLVSRITDLHSDTGEMSNSRDIRQRRYTNAIERCKNIFVQSYNMKSIPSAASGNRRVTQRRIPREGETNGREGELRGRKREKGEKEREKEKQHCESLHTNDCLCVRACACVREKERER